MRRICGFLRYTITALLALAPVSAWAGLTIIPTYDTSITGNANAAAIEDTIQGVINDFEALYSNNGTIHVAFNASGAEPGDTNTDFVTATYTAYHGLLSLDSSLNPANTILSGALTYLPGGANAPAGANEASGHGFVVITTAMARVGLGISAIGPCFDASEVELTSCGGTSAAAGYFDGIISMGSFVGFTDNPGNINALIQTGAGNIVAHELDELLGGGGAGSMLNNVAFCQQNPSVSGCSTIQNYFGPTDLYRYAATGTDCSTVTSTGSFTTSSGATACLSLNGGASAIVQFNQTGLGDYGDFYPEKSSIQSYYSGGGPFAYNTASPEFAMMASIGWNPTATISAPEPASLLLLSTGLAAMGLARRRRGVESRS